MVFCKATPLEETTIACNHFAIRALIEAMGIALHDCYPGVVNVAHGCLPAPKFAFRDTLDAYWGFRSGAQGTESSCASGAFDLCMLVAHLLWFFADFAHELTDPATAATTGDVVA